MQINSKLLSYSYSRTITSTTLFNSLVLPLFDYASIIWGDKNNAVLMDHLQVLQNNAARVILDLPRFNSPASKALDQLNWKHLFLRRKHRRCIAVYKCLNGLINYDFNITKNSDIHNYKTRGRDELHLPLDRTNWGKQRFIYRAFKDWNLLDPDIKSISSYDSFKPRLNT